jgi:hypothetical protein
MSDDRDWTSFEITEIRTKQLANVPYRVIGDQYQVSRSAIAGLLRRNGFSKPPNGASQNRWTTEQLITLKQLLNDGLSHGVIAERLHVSRNAVTAKVRDKGWSKIKLRRTARMVLPRRVASRRPTLPAIYQPELTAVSWDDLGSQHCHWPVQDHPRLFCGAISQQGSSYCQYHRGIGTQATRPSIRPLRWRR